MSYAQLVEMNRQQLIEAQELAMSHADHDTLRKIAMVMVGFNPKNLVDRKPVVYMSDEVEDVRNCYSADKEEWQYEDSFWVND